MLARLPARNADIDALVAVGRRLFAAQPYEDVSIDAVCAGVGIRRDQFYRLFPNKRAYYLEILHGFGRQLVRETRPAEGAPIGQVVRASLRVFLDFVHTYPAIYSSMFDGGVGSDEAGRAIVRYVEEAFAERIFERLGVTKPSPQIRTLVAGWLGFIQASALAWVRHPGVSRDDLILFQVRALMGTVRHPSWTD